MALSIKNDTTDHLAREVCAITGESITEAVTASLLERLARLRPHQPMSEAEREARRQRIEAIVKETSKLPRINDHLTDDEILGYDEYGLPT